MAVMINSEARMSSMAVRDMGRVVRSPGNSGGNGSRSGSCCAGGRTPRIGPLPVSGSPASEDGCCISSSAGMISSGKGKAGGTYPGTPPTAHTKSRTFCASTDSRSSTTAALAVSTHHWRQPTPDDDRRGSARFSAGASSAAGVQRHHLRCGILSCS